MKKFLIVFLITASKSIVAQNVGIGTVNPNATLEVIRGNGISGTAAFHGTLHISHFNYGTDEDTYIRAGKHSRNVIINDIPGGRVGIGLASPLAKLSVSATGNDLTGAAASTTFRTNSGFLDIFAGNEISLASFGFISNTNSSLGIRARRHTNGNDWTSTTLLLGYDADNNIRAGGAFLALSGSGNTGIGLITPSEKLEVSGNVKATDFIYTTPKTFFFTLSGVDFRSTLSTDTSVINLGSGGVYMNSSLPYKRMLAPVHLPHGAVMVNMIVYAYDNSSSENLNFVFYRKSILSVFSPTVLCGIATNGSFGTTTSYQISVNGLGNIVDNSVYTYYISADVETSGGIWTNEMEVRAIVIEYTLSATQ